MSEYKKEIVRPESDDETRESRRTPGSVKYSISQELIDDILANELKEIIFPVNPIYNPHLPSDVDGETRCKILPWGEKEIKQIEIGKQHEQGREHLIDTLLHEYYEAEIMIKQYENEYFKKLDKATRTERHKWINDQISDFFKNRRN